MPQATVHEQRYVKPDDDIKFADTKTFNYFIGLVIMANGLVMGLETDFAVKGGENISDRIGWYIADNVFTLAFLVEAVLRICPGSSRATNLKEGVYYYFVGWPPQEDLYGHIKAISEGDSSSRGTIRQTRRASGAADLACFQATQLVEPSLFQRFKEWLKCFKLIKFDGWNCTDFTLLMLSIVDTWILWPIGGGGALRLVSVFRILRVLKLAKFVKLLRAYRELWLIVCSLFHVVKTLFWVGVLLLFLIYAGALFVTVILGGTDEGPSDYHKSVWTRYDYWGTTARSMFTLLQILTGDKWGSSVIKPIVERTPFLIAFFVFFYGVAAIGLMNVIIAVVIERTLETAQENEERQKEELRQQQEEIFITLREIFEKADTDGDGLLDQMELHTMMKKKSVMKSMESLELPGADLEEIFGMLLEEKQNSVTITDFFRSCWRVRGPSRARDLIQLGVTVKSSMERCKNISEDLDACNKRLVVAFRLLEQVDNDIFQVEDEEMLDPVIAQRRRRQQKCEDLVGSLSYTGGQCLGVSRDISSLPGGGSMKPTPPGGSRSPHGLAELQDNSETQSDTSCQNLRKSLMAALVEQPDLPTTKLENMETGTIVTLPEPRPRSPPKPPCAYTLQKPGSAPRVHSKEMSIKPGGHIGLQLPAWSVAEQQVLFTLNWSDSWVDRLMRELKQHGVKNPAQVVVVDVHGTQIKALQSLSVHKDSFPLRVIEKSTMPMMVGPPPPSGELAKAIICR